jgi:hypothetical protein
VRQAGARNQNTYAYFGGEIRREKNKTAVAACEFERERYRESEKR